MRSKLRFKKNLLLLVCVAAGGIYWFWLERDSQMDHRSNSHHAKVSSKPSKLEARPRKTEKSGQDSNRVPAQSSPGTTPRNSGKPTQSKIESAKRTKIHFKQKRIKTAQGEESGDFIDESGNRYTLLIDRYAIKRTFENQHDYPEALFQNGHFIVEGAPPPGARGLVVENGETGNLAVFTGILKVKLSDLEFIDQVVSDFHCSVDEVYEHLGAALYQFDDYEETLAAYKALSKNPLVLRVEIELLEGQRSAK